MLDLLETPITVVHAFVCVLLMLVVLIQPGKSGGLGAALGGAGAQQLFGGRGAGNFLSKATWVSAVVFFLTSITLAYIATSTGDSLQDAVAAEMPLEAQAPAITAPVTDDSSAKNSESAADSSAKEVVAKDVAVKTEVVGTEEKKAVVPTPESAKAPVRAMAPKSNTVPTPVAPLKAVVLPKAKTAPALQKTSPAAPAQQ